MNSQVQISNLENNSHDNATAPSDITYVVQSPNLVSSFQPTVTNTNIQPDSFANFQIQPVHPTNFFYRPPNDFYHYYVTCKEISNDTVDYLLINY
jgi:hypothetical protein